MADKAILNCDIDKYPDVVTAKNGSDVLENGAIVALGGLVDSELGNDCYKIERLSEGCRFGILDSVALQYDERLDERDYELKASEIDRVRLPHKGLCMTLAKKHFDGVVAVGDELELKADTYKLTKKTTGAGIARVEELYNFNGQDSVYVSFI